jgi:hypothetical protein
VLAELQVKTSFIKASVYEKKILGICYSLGII